MTSRIVQFAYTKVNHPADLEPVTVDCRVLRNPWFPGITPKVAKFKVHADPKFNEVVDKGVLLLKSNPTIYVGCDFGVHRSVIVALEIANRFIRPLEIEFANGIREVLE